jgi:hypothetical protein
MTTLIEAARQALEALETCMYPQQKQIQALTSLRQAIEQAEKQQALDKKAENARELGLDYEPVQSEKQEPTEDMVLALRGASGLGTEDAIDALRDVLAVMPFYTTPQPQREFVGLTQEDIDIAFDDTQEGGGFNEFARAIEQTLRRKNS